MLLNGMIELINNRQRPVATVSLHLLLPVLLLSLFVISTSSVKAGGFYSDSWVDDSDPDQGYIVGVGVSRMVYGRTGPDGELQTHEAAADMTLTSPQGRTVTVTAVDAAGSYSTPYHASAEATLAWNWEDLGDYTITTRHYSDCPYQEFGSSSADVRVGVSHAVYSQAQCQSDGCLYSIITGCETSCKSETIKVKTPSICHSYATRKTAYHQSFIGPIICVNLTATTEVHSNPGTCWDQDFYP